MKKKAIALVLAILLSCPISNVYSVSAASCPPHSNYKDTITSVYSWGSSHLVGTGLYLNGVEITVKCSITTNEKTHTVSCGVCGTSMGTYLERTESHSLSH